MTTGVATDPAEYITNTDEIDWLAFDATNDLTGSEAVVSAACELRTVHERIDAPAAAFLTPATQASNVVTQKFDATVLAAVHYEWIWKLTLNTGAVRSYRTVLRVENHD